jgi:UDP-N-acetylmuramoylalanine--D-glutamate ligase
VLNARDDWLRDIDPPASTVWFGADRGYDAEGQTVTLRGETILRAHDSPLPGEHNALNICAALAALSTLGLRGGMEPSGRGLADALRDFHPLPHRLQEIGRLDSVVYVDDSISTAPESTMAALKTFEGRPLALIAGGYERNQHYEELARAILDSEVVAVVGLPDTGARLLEAVHRSAAHAPSTRPSLMALDDMDSAVAAATGALDGEGVVLLSPAAPSFNAYRDFEERGERFEIAVARLHASQATS